MDLEILIAINVAIIGAGIGMILGTALFLMAVKWMIKKGFF